MKEKRSLKSRERRSEIQITNYRLHHTDQRIKRPMKHDPLSLPLFEMRLEEIHRADPWLRYEITINDFIALFPLCYKNGLPLKPNHPAVYGVDRDVFLKVLVAFRQCFY